MHAEAMHLHEVLVFLAAAGVVVPLIRRLGISPVLGFLVVGLLIGPYGLARFSETLPWIDYVVISQIEGVRALAELGVVFLLFMIGLELSIDRLWAMRRMVFGLGGAQVVVSGTVIAMIALMFDNTPAAAIVLGASFALSSTAIVMQLLSENQRLGTETGQTSFSILLFQDLAVLPILFLVGILAAQTGGSPILAFALAMAQAALAVLVILLLGRLVLRPVFGIIGSAESREMFLASVLLVIIGTAVLTEWAGLSMALGAFLAGLLFSETEYRHEIQLDIEPFKGLLLGLFFISVGMSIDIVQIAAKPFWLIASVIGLFAIKAALLYVLTRLFAKSPPVAAETALLLGQGGEFAFLVLGLAASLQLMPSDTVQFMLFVAGLTMLFTPLVAHFARRLAIWMTAREARAGQMPEGPSTDLKHHIVIAGYGRIGQLLGEILSEREIPFVGLDNDANLIRAFHEAGACVYYGDASQPQLLRHFGIDRAAALVVTMDSARAAESVVAAARRQRPDLPIYARARDATHALRLLETGAHHVVPETTEASLQLGEAVLKGIGLTDEVAHRAIEVRRREEAAKLATAGEADT